jgi:hypothetical protein
VVAVRACDPAREPRQQRERRVALEDERDGEERGGGGGAGGGDERQAREPEMREQERDADQREDDLGRHDERHVDDHRRAGDGTRDAAADEHACLGDVAAHLEHGEEAVHGLADPAREEHERDGRAHRGREQRAPPERVAEHGRQVEEGDDQQAGAGRGERGADVADALVGEHHHEQHETGDEAGGDDAWAARCPGGRLHGCRAPRRETPPADNCVPPTGRRGAPMPAAMRKGSSRRAT